MKIAIQHKKGSFSESWIAYCEKKNINYKLVNCYASDIMQQLYDCDALMWHFNQNSTKDILFSKQLIYSVEASGKEVFPNFNTAWHFDDKLGQKYLLEALDSPLVPTWLFYDKKEAFQWAYQTSYPKVIKLRGGAGSQNVRLVHSLNNANKLIRQAFSRGFPAYSAWGSLKERWRFYRLGKTNFADLLKGVARFVIPPPFARVKGREYGYLYFQDFIPGNDHDIRVIVIGDKAFAIKRMVRKDDFRASGSGSILFERELFDENTIKLSFEYAAKLKSQCVAFDYVYSDSNPLIVEISYGFLEKAYQPCPGYWDSDLNYYEGKFNPCNWMVDLVLDKVASGNEK